MTLPHIGMDELSGQETSLCRKASECHNNSSYHSGNCFWMFSETWTKRTYIRRQSLPVCKPSILLRRNDRNSSRKRRGYRTWSLGHLEPSCMPQKLAAIANKLLTVDLLLFVVSKQDFPTDFSASIGAKSERKGTARWQPRRGQRLHFPPQTSSWCWSSLSSHRSIRFHKALLCGIKLGMALAHATMACRVSLHLLTTARSLAFMS